ncbi:hypothetical protein ABH908_000246 [Pseudomonas frederiksbergensis]|uniref:hypothetical protein n=1 Tax=Pseudomonas TaxID=286 RepID=UPI003D21A4AB
MTLLTVDDVLQDEQFCFDFILKSPQHSMVLTVIHEAIKQLNDQLRQAIQANDVNRQRILDTKGKFLYRAAADRLAIYQEREFVDALKWALGDEAYQAVKERQLEAIKESMAKRRLEFDFTKSAFEQSWWESKILGTRPDWVKGRFNMNIAVHCALSACRKPVLELDLALTDAYANGRVDECWSLSLKLDEARRNVAFLTLVIFDTDAYQITKSLYGQDTPYEILAYLNTYSRLPHLRKIQQRCSGSRNIGRSMLASVKDELTQVFQEQIARHAA